MGGNQVQNEYDQDVARLGRTFAVGDERGTLELTRHLTALQQTLITSLQHSTEVDTYDIVPNHLTTLSTSTTTRSSIFRALAAQSQRLSQSVPIPKTLSLPSGSPAPASVCSGKLGKHRWSAVGNRLIEYPCRLCRASWTPLAPYHQHQRLYSVGDLRLSISMLVQKHLEDTGGIQCRVCCAVDGRRMFECGIGSIVEHLDTHTSSEIRAAYGRSGWRKKGELGG